MKRKRKYGEFCKLGFVDFATAVQKHCHNGLLETSKAKIRLMLCTAMRH